MNWGSTGNRTKRLYRERGQKRKFYFKELAHATVDHGESKSAGSKQAEDSGRAEAM